MTEAYIYDAVRTPRGKGKKSGSLHEITALSLATQVLQAIRDRNELNTSNVDDVVLGCVSPVGEQGADIARVAVLNADYAETTAGVQVDRFCASGLEACNMAASKVMTGEADMAIGGGVESMSRVPMGASGGAWSSDPQVALKTYFAPQGMGAMGFDEVIKQRYPELEAINHVHHAGNSSGIVDGASAVLFGSKEMGEKFGLKPRARIRAMASIGSEPGIMLTGPTYVSQKVLKKAGMEASDIDLYELNEAFASVVLLMMQNLNIPHEKMNVNGGAIAMGHPLGATGGMILGTMVDELERSGKETALVTLCVGAGMGTATIIERV